MNRTEDAFDGGDEDDKDHDNPAPQDSSIKDAAASTMKTSRQFIALPSSGESATEVQPDRLSAEGEDGQNSAVNKQRGNSVNGTGSRAKVGESIPILNYHNGEHREKRFVFFSIRKRCEWKAYKRDILRNSGCHANLSNLHLAYYYCKFALMSKIVTAIFK